MPIFNRWARLRYSRLINEVKRDEEVSEAISGGSGGGVTVLKGLVDSSTVSSEYYTWDHGQGTAPTLAWGELVFTSNRDGYSVGDIVYIHRILELDETDYGVTIWANDTQIGSASERYNSLTTQVRRTSSAMINYHQYTEFYLVGMWVNS